MKNFKNYCSVFASIIAFSNSVYAQDPIQIESAPASQTESVSTTPGATSVVNIFPIQAPQASAPVAQQPVAVPVMPSPIPVPVPEPMPAPIEEPAPVTPPCERVTVGFRGMLGISRFSVRSRESGHNIDYVIKNSGNQIDMLQPSAGEIFLPYLEGGIVIDIPLHHYFAVSTGVLYSQKANHRKCFIDSVNVKSENSIVTRIGYIKIPGQITLRNWFTDDKRFDISAGPYMAFGIHGKVKERYTSDEDYILLDIEKKIDVFDESIIDNMSMARVAPYKRFDFGFCFTTTYEFKRYCIGANFDMGLTDITKPDHKEGNTRTRSIGLFFGYMLR